MTHNDVVTTSMTLRLAEPAEFGAAGEVTEAAYRADGVLGHDDYAETLRNAADRAKRAELIVAVDGGKVLGTVTFCPPGSPYRELAHDDSEGEFRMLAVAPSARRQGVARALVECCLDRSRALGQTSMVLCSAASMSGAHALYASMGFTRVPELDWCPVPSVELLGFHLAL
ncbi:MAG: GNAT family N-acetyltransferase [Nocardioidaceae bacterium]